MSFGFQLPEEHPVCECKYDEAHDRMDREDCHFHSNEAEDPIVALQVERKPPASSGGVRKVEYRGALIDRRTAGSSIAQD